MRISRCLLAVALCVLVVALAGSAGAAEYAWFEGEEPDSTNYDVAFGGWGNVDYLSEGDWLHVELDDGDLAGVPEEGIRIGYAFEVSASGDHEVWARLGYDHLWVPFQWRVDGGEWRTVRNDHTPTVDHMEIQRWNALVWTMLGEADLSAGAHTLQIRIPVPEPDAEGKRPRFLYAADAFCIHGGSFRPNGKHRPGAEWRAQRDLEAAEMVFRLPEADAEGKRTEMSLEGRWQLARYDDPDAIENRLGPIPDVPPAAELHWSSIGVPGDRNQSRPDLAHCHRYLYRTRVFVPESHAGHSFFLEFPQVSMIGTLFVNGERCGWTKAPYALWRCDVTDAIRPGEVNEVWVGIKDTVYAMSPELMGPDQTLRQFFKVPLDDLRQNQGVTMKFDMPVALWTATGILDRPLFVSAGEVYAEDVFAIPSVQEEKLGLEVTLRNPTDRPVNVELANKVVPWKGGDVEKRFAPQQVTVPARGKTCIELSEGWADPKLWWPDSPHLYNVATTLRRDGHVLDVKKTRFGFREWDWSGTKFRLNGVPWQFRSDHGYGGGALPLEGVRKLKASGQNIVRLTEGMGATWCGLNSRHTIGFFDEQGIAVRRGTIWNGMFASYQLARRVEVDGKRVKRPNRALFDNTREAILAFVRGQRNHPSILIWSLENEIIYINARNLGNLDVTEPEVRKISDAVMALDPTRPTMVDGGRALTDQSLPVNGCHYPEANVRNYPDEAYVFEKSRQTGRSKPWPMAMDKPIFLGESYYSGGKSPSWYATLGGERCFIGIAECEYARGLFAKMLAEGYRWFGIAAFDFLVRPNIHTNSFRPVAVFCREWNWTFASGDTVERTLKAFNDTRHDDPVDVHWRLELGGEPVDEGSRRCEMAPGSSEMFGISLSMPDVAERTEGHLILTCERRGEQVFREEKDVSVLPPDAGPRPEVQPGELAVYDPSGPVRERLRRRGIAFTKVDDPGALPDGWEVLVLGPDSLSEKDALSPRWRRLAAGGRRILVLDQEQPLQHDAVPADVELTDFVGRVAFMENPTHPAFEGLKQKDFFCWSGGHVVYRNVYRKPTRGGQSLMQCDVGLACTALVECPVQDGLLMLCQALVGSKLDADPVAGRLFDNLLAHALAYGREARPTAAVVEPDSPKQKLLTESGLAYRLLDDPVRAVASGRFGIVIVDATPDNLASLTARADAVDAFTESGGWLMLWGVTPEGLEAFNSLVGAQHLMRPFRQERVYLRSPRDPLVAGLSQRDVAMSTGRKYMRFMETEIPSDDAFTFVVDYTDVAPFAEWPEPEYFKHFDEDPLNSGHHPLNMVNGMTRRDFWRFIFYLHLFDDPPTEWTIELPRREEVAGLAIIPNPTYHHLETLRLAFDGREEDAVTLELEEHGEGPPKRQEFDFTPRPAKTVTFDLVEWEEVGSQDVLGIDNLWITAQRSDEFLRKVKPLLNIGALVRYPQGKGGIVLNQVNTLESEANPVNAEKKKAIVSTMLRNMGAAFGREGVLRPGERFNYRPVPLGTACNLYLSSEWGWPDEQYDLSGLPLGRQKLHGIAYKIRDFETSPLESAVTLSGMPGVEAPASVVIPVETTADALFFLHTFHARPTWRDGPEAEGNPVVFQYVVHYADGEQATVDVAYGEGTGNWISPDPADLPEAGLAWSAPLPGEGAERAAVYQLRWDNQRPDARIDALELRYPAEGGEKRGAPVLLGVTAADAVE